MKGTFTISSRWLRCGRSLLLWIVLLIAPAIGSAAAKTCPALTEARKAELVRFVENKHGGASAAGRLRVASAELVGSSCFREVRLVSAEEPARREYRFFLSPDQRFLARELLDLSVDPLEQERRRDAT